jgi:hypothetical protein
MLKSTQMGLLQAWKRSWGFKNRSRADWKAGDLLW